MPRSARAGIDAELLVILFEARVGRSLGAALVEADLVRLWAALNGRLDAQEIS